MKYSEEVIYLGVLIFGLVLIIRDLLWMLNVLSTH
jgi:hypothetical protein